VIIAGSSYEYHAERLSRIDYCIPVINAKTVKQLMVAAQSIWAYPVASEERRLLCLAYAHRMDRLWKPPSIPDIYQGHRKVRSEND